MLTHTKSRRQPRRRKSPTRSIPSTRKRRLLHLHPRLSTREVVAEPVQKLATRSTRAIRNIHSSETRTVTALAANPNQAKALGP